MNKRFLLVASCLAFLFLATGGYAFQDGGDHFGAVVAKESAANVSGEIIKSPNDHRKYRYTTLKNGIKLLLISDPKADKAAVAVDVNAGSFHEPAHRPGLAHFLEHMLFLGNDKYPDIDSYFEFIRAHGGSANAYTSSVRTQYFFDINADWLQPAMDQLAQFFVSPKLDRAYIDRERNAVDAEYRMHLKEDQWRQYFALGATVNKKHPRSRFTIGSLETLDNRNVDALWNDLNDFYEKWYVGSNISVVVYGNEALRKLEKWASTSFKYVPSGQKPDVHIGKSLYTSSQLGVRINIIPLQEKRELALEFPMPSIWKVYDKKPLSYLGRLLGYEGKGSLYSFLKHKGWIDSLGAGGHDLPGEYSEFSIRMALTEEGLEHVDDITAIVFDYIDLIRKQGMQKWLFAESAAVAALEFKFLESANSQATVSALASKLHYYPVKHILDSGFIYKEFDQELIKSYLDLMVPSNLRQIVVAPQLPVDQTEHFFEAEYSMTPLSKTLKNRLSVVRSRPELTIPEINKFLPENLNVTAAEKIDKPNKLIDKPGLTIWYLHDGTFSVPRNDIRLKFSTNKAARTPFDVVNLYLYKALLDNQLNEDAYPAREAGLSYGFYAGREGLYLSVSGYSDKQADLLQLITSRLVLNDIDEKSFALEKAALERNLKNQAFLAPYQQGLDAVSEVLFANEYSAKQLLTALSSVTLNTLKSYITGFYQGLHIEGLFHGSLTKEQVKFMAQMLSDVLEYKSAAPYEEQMRVLSGKHNLSLDMDIDHNDSTLLLYFQASDNDLKKRATVALLGRLLSTPFFTSLRTEQQLGYVAFAGGYPVDNWPGLIMVLQSPVAAPDQLQQRILDFISGFQVDLDALADVDFNRYQQGLIDDLMKRDTNLSERTQRLWSAIEDKEFGFDEREKLVSAIKQVTKEDLMQEYKKLLVNRSNESLTIKSYGMLHHGKAYEESLKNDDICKTSECFDTVFSESKE